MEGGGPLCIGELGSSALPFPSPPGRHPLSGTMPPLPSAAMFCNDRSQQSKHLLHRGSKP